MIPLKEMTKKDNKPEWIIIHHTGGTDANPLEDTSHHTFETIQNWHINGLGFENIGYHYVIEKGGKLGIGRPETYHGAHTQGYNKKSIGICLSGNFDVTEPSKEQKETLTKLLKEVATRWQIPVEKIVPHRTFANKSCYGNNLPDDWAQLLVNKKDMNKLLQSSSNPENLSMTIQGILMSLVPIIIAIFQSMDIEITETVVVETIQSITAVVAGVTMLVGMIRKIWNLRK